jgi:ABC-type Fe3+-siderophore transport system permease subunit
MPLSAHTKAFWLAAVPVGTAMAVMALMHGRPIEVIFSGLSVGLVFGTVTSLLSYRAERRRARKARKERL